jgi:hypothetical protein
MNRAVTAPGQSMAHQPGAVESVSYLTNLEQSSSVTPPPAQRARETRYEVSRCLGVHQTETCMWLHRHTRVEVPTAMSMKTVPCGM